MLTNHYINRKKVMEWLRLGESQSYRLIESCYGSLISTKAILELLNRSRRHIAEAVLEIPIDLMKADELVAIPELADSGLTARKLLNWTQNRHKKVPPHFRFNQLTVRFSKSLFLKWLDALAAQGRHP